MANFLSDVGRRDEALEVAGEAVAIRRQLAEASPGAYLPDLAASLNNMANALTDVGRRDEALEVAGEAVTDYRQLAEASPGAYRPALATSLNNMANFLSDVGRRDEALEVASEAVTIRRQLAEASPGAYLPDLAMSLNNMAGILSDVGRRDEALEVAGEAVTDYRQLAEASPGAYLPDLATSLNNMARILSDVGRRDEALEVAGEAVTIRRPLADASPGTYLPYLATSLNNMASVLNEAGRSGEAEELLDDILGHFSGSPLAQGHILLARARWRVTQNNLDGAVSDLAAALSASDDAGDRTTRGRTRQQLRGLPRTGPFCLRPSLGPGECTPAGMAPVPDRNDDLLDAVLAWVNTQTGRRPRPTLTSTPQPCSRGERKPPLNTSSMPTPELSPSKSTSACSGQPAHTDLTPPIQPTSNGSSRPS